MITKNHLNFKNMSRKERKETFSLSFFLCCVTVWFIVKPDALDKVSFSFLFNVNGFYFEREVDEEKEWHVYPHLLETLLNVD